MKLGYLRPRRMRFITGYMMKVENWTVCIRRSLKKVCHLIPPYMQHWKSITKKSTEGFAAEYTEIMRLLKSSHWIPRQVNDNRFPLQHGMFEGVRHCITDIWTQETGVSYKLPASFSFLTDRELCHLEDYCYLYTSVFYFSVRLWSVTDDFLNIPSVRFEMDW